MNGAVRGATKVALGVILPMGLFAVYHVALLSSVAGKGEDSGFGGMTLYFLSFIMIPALSSRTHF